MMNLLEAPATVQEQQYLPKSVYYSRFTIIIPAYNEEKRIYPVLSEIADFISFNGLPWDVIVSIDGDDGTYEIVDIMSEKFTFIHPLGGKGRNGKGGAVKRAVNIATGEFIILMDADGSVSLKSIISAVDQMEFFHMVIFDRYSNSQNSIPAVRRFASRGFNMLLRATMGIRVNDTQCGYKIMRADYARDAFEKISVTNAFFDVALFYYMKKKGAKYVEIPVEYSHGEDSRFNVMGLVLGIGTSLIAFRIRNSRFYKHVPRKIIDLYYRKFRWI